MTDYSPTARRLTTPRKIRPLDPKAKLAPYRVPEIPSGKFRDVPGQAAMDFSSDDWDALEEPDGDPAP